MRIRWYGQSAFLLDGDHSVFTQLLGTAGEPIVALPAAPVAG
jgi:hypothetical protein